MEIQVVHALLAGQPLCRLFDKPPLEWPQGHVFTSHENLEALNCPTCLDRAQFLQVRNSVPPEFIREVGLAEDPEVAVKLLLTRSVDEACATIDQMNVVQASIVLVALTIKAINLPHAQAQAIVDRAKSLGIRGSQGPVAARNQHYRETGEFFV